MVLTILYNQDTIFNDYRCLAYSGKCSLSLYTDSEEEIIKQPNSLIKIIAEQNHNVIKIYESLKREYDISFEDRNYYQH